MGLKKKGFKVLLIEGSLGCLGETQGRGTQMAKSVNFSMLLPRFSLRFTFKAPCTLLRLGSNDGHRHVVF